MKLDGEHEEMIRLIMRSQDHGDGWRSVSDLLRGHIEGTVLRRPELYETKDVDGKFMIRLSERGIIISEYI